MNKMSSSAESDKVRASHILVKHQGSRRKASWKDAEGRVISNTTREIAVSQLKSLREDIVSGKAKFKDVASRYSDCSSAKRDGDLAKKIVEYVATTNLDARYSSVDDDAVRLARDADATNNASINTEVCDDGSAHCMMGTIFSPPFHNSRSTGGEIVSGADFLKYFQTEDHKVQDQGKENIQGGFVEQ